MSHDPANQVAPWPPARTASTDHRAFQTSARHGLAWWEVDPTYLTIKLLSLFGIAGNIKLPKLSAISNPGIAGARSGRVPRRR